MIFGGNAHQGGIAEHKISITRQAKTLGISRGSVFYCPRPVSIADLAFTRVLKDAEIAISRDGKGA